MIITYFFNGQFQITVFSRFCYVLLCNHEYFHCLNHRQTEDYITRRNKTVKENYNLKEGRAIASLLYICRRIVLLNYSLTKTAN